MALVGLPLDVGAGTYAEDPLSWRCARYRSPSGENNFRRSVWRIADDRMATPPPELEARIVAEQQRIAEWTSLLTEREPDTRFELPA